MIRVVLGRTFTRLSIRTRPLLASGFARPPAARSLHLTRPTQTIPPGFDANNPLLKNIQSNPRVLAAMVGALQLLQSKGYIDPTNPKPPSFAKLMQIMGDPDVRKMFADIQKLMQEEGISFSPADLSALMSGGIAPSTAKPRDDLNTTDGAKDGLFKRIASSIKSRS